MALKKKVAALKTAMNFIMRLQCFPLTDEDLLISLLNFPFEAHYNYLVIAPEAFVAPTFGCTSAKRGHHTMMFEI